MPQKKTLTEQEAHALIVKEARYRQGCADFAPLFTLRRAEPDTSGRYPRANWDATPEWPRDCARAFREAVLRTRASMMLRGRAS